MKTFQAKGLFLFFSFLNSSVCLLMCIAIAIIVATVDFSLSSFAMRKEHSSMASNVTDCTACLASFSYAFFWVRRKNFRFLFFCLTYIGIRIFFSFLLFLLTCYGMKKIEKFQKKVRAWNVLCINSNMWERIFFGIVNCLHQIEMNFVVLWTFCLTILCGLKELNWKFLKF